MNPRLEGRYSSYFQEKRIELTEKQAFNYHLCRIDNMISKLIPICIIFFVLCPIAVSQGITSDQWIKMGEEFIQIDSYKEALDAFNKSI